MYMGIVIVEVCSGNIITSVDIESIIEEEYPEVAVLITDCLSYCGLCAMRPYAIVNNKRVFAESIEECLDKIRAEIEKELAQYDV